MKKSLINKSSFFVSLLLILGGIGSILFGVLPLLSGILIALGVLGSLFSIRSSEHRNQKLEHLIEAQATLLAQAGIGNIYSQAFKKELSKTGSVKSGIKLLEKALDADPNDIDALSLLSSSLAMCLSLDQWIGINTDSPAFNKSLLHARTLAKRGNKLYPDNNIFLDVLGILCDLEGNHKQARKHFIKSGKLRNDPYWRLLLATSWHKSGEDQKAYIELKKAKDENANGWLFNFYYGRALNFIGNHGDAQNYLALAFKERKFRPELLYEMSQSRYLKGEFYKASKYIFYLSFIIMPTYMNRGLKYFLQAIAYIGIGLACSVAKLLWKVSRHLPYIRDFQLYILSPDEPEFTLGNLMVKKGNYKEAELFFRVCCDIIPTKAQSHANLALCLALQGYNNEALAECDKSIELDQTNSYFKHNKQQIESGKLNEFYHKYVV